jgi:hypothetical protein
LTVQSQFTLCKSDKDRNKDRGKIGNSKNGPDHFIESGQTQQAQGQCKNMLLLNLFIWVLWVLFVLCILCVVDLFSAIGSPR